MILQVGTSYNGITISAMHTILYNQVKYLSKKGVCYASNSYLAKKIGRSKTRVSHLLTELRRAGLIAIRLVYAESKDNKPSREVVARFIKVFSKPQKGETEIKKENLSEDEKGARAGNNAIKLGIPAFVVAMMRKQFGTERIENALAIVTTSRSVRKPVGLFMKALYEGWSLSKRALKNIGKEPNISTIDVPDDIFKNRKVKLDYTSDFIQDLRKRHPELPPFQKK